MTSEQHRLKVRLLHEWAGYLHACLTSCIPLTLQYQMARKADA